MTTLECTATQMVYWETFRWRLAENDQTRPYNDV